MWSKVKLRDLHSCDALAVLGAEAEEVGQIAAAMRALEGEDAGSSDGALEDDFVLAATTVRARASTTICRCLSAHCCCYNTPRTHLSAQPDSNRMQHADSPVPEHCAHEVLTRFCKKSPFWWHDRCMLVMQAGADAAAADAATAPATPPQEASIDEGDTSSEWPSDEAGSDEAGGRVDAAGEGSGDRVRVVNGSSAGSDAGSRRAGSIASTYWRPERTNRKEALSAIDEQCATIQSTA